MKYFISIFLLLASSGNAQEQSFTKNSIKFELGYSYNEGAKEEGSGLVYLIGYQRTFNRINRLKVSGNFMYGSFSSENITDVSQQFYTVKNFSIIGHFDAIRFRQISIVISAGGFVNFTNGLFANNGELQNDDSPDYFNKTYLGINSGIGIKFQNPKNRISYELELLNLEFGNNVIFPFIHRSV